MPRCWLVVAIALLVGCAPSASVTTRPTSRPPAATTVASLPAPTPEAPPAASPPPTAELPTAVPSAEPTAAVAADGTLVDNPRQIAGAVPVPRDSGALAAAFGRAAPDVRATPAAPRALGDIERFWVLDRASGTYRQVEAQLRYAGPVLLMYVDTQVDIAQDAIERSARVFEERIYPRNRALFGQEPSPGVDGDPRLTVLNTNLSVGGYFSSDDAVRSSANRFSNQREMFVIGVNSFPVGSDSYAATLAHEFQHMIAWNRHQQRPAWLDEGMASLAEDLNGYVDHSSALSYLVAPDLQLTAWQATLPHYGMSRLFARYFYEQYTGEDGLAEVLGASGNTQDVLAALAARRRPDIAGFPDLFADWAVANLLNDPAVGDGRFAYSLLPATVTPTPPEASSANATVHQFGADYIGPLAGPLVLRFDGADSVSLAGVPPASGSFAWWSGRGDESVMTLTRELDLSGVSQATLRFRAWYEIERHFDYAYVTVSDDGGATWRTLSGASTTAEDPQGQNLGEGFTGVSGAPGADPLSGQRGSWIDETMDLSPYAGKRVLLRFWLITDPAINASGLLLDDIQVPEIGFADGAEADTGDWQAQGFVRTTGALAQRWALRLVRYGAGVSVEPVAVDEAGRAEVDVPAGERAVLVVAGATPYTTEPAAYSYSIIQP